MTTPASVAETVLRIPLDPAVAEAAGVASVGASLLVPPGARACYVLAHGAGAGMDHAFLVAAAHGLAARGIAATPLAAAAPEWLVRFREQGRFGRRTMEQAS